MRKFKLVQLLVVVALLVLPVAAVSAQSGSMNNGNVWDGASDWPGVTGIVVPEALPQTGAIRAGLTEFEWQVMLNEMVASGVSASSGHPAALAETEAGDIYWASAQAAPSALPETGNEGQAMTCAESWLMTDPDGFYTHECGSAAAVSGAVEPPALPETGTNGPPVGCSESWLMTDPDGFYTYGCGSEAALLGAVEPSALPETGTGPVSPIPSPWYSAAGAVWDDQVISALAGFPVEIMAEPAALPETGNSGDRLILNGAYNEEFTSPSELAPLAPETLPETGYDQERALREANAQLRHDGSVPPASLPETGAASSKPPYYQALPPFLSGQTPDSLPETGATGDTMTDLAETQGIVPSGAPWAMPE